MQHVDLDALAPAGIKLLPFSRHHGLLLEHDAFQSAIMRAVPDWLDRLEVQAQLGMGITALSDGKIVAIGGITPLLPEVAEFFLLLNDGKKPATITLGKFCRHFIGLWQFSRLQMTVDCQNVGGVRFAKWLGFEIEGRQRKLIGGRDHFMMSRVK